MNCPLLNSAHSSMIIMTTALEAYIDYLKWQLTEDAITSEPVDLEELQDEIEAINSRLNRHTEIEEGGNKNVA